MNQLDARGYSCPEPVLMTQRALKEQGAPLAVLVDNETSLQNVCRFAENHGRRANWKAVGEDYEITIS